MKTMGPELDAHGVAPESCMAFFLGGSAQEWGEAGVKAAELEAKDAELADLKAKLERLYNQSM